ncbi:polysaccharide deacetylase family protein [Ammoniphilus sp. YIM 78166]|uniref:polysaccharide deacetylase family protein n=1 Tax=Ammoniphilus sp. YIM 78166 TaxID=1644106 RepID=UPI0014307B72|nr:polysaccharide deacetylase family protein [Ammoniphilus sp. YIM 78166]
MMKFTKAYLFLFLLLPLLTVTVHAQESELPSAPIYIDNKPISTKYLIRNGHLLVPAIFLKHTGAFVDWNETHRAVVVHTKDKMFSMPMGKKYTDDFIRATNTWKRNPLSIETVDFNGVPYVPLVDVAEKLNMDVRYDAAQSRTHITTHIPGVQNRLDRAKTSQKLVALTFDDGPEARYTPRILDALKKKAAPATFFVMGKQVQSYPEIMKRIVTEGHGIGNHTWGHPNLAKTWSAQVKEEIRRTQNELQRVTGRKSDLFRPPFGELTKSDLLILHELGMKTIMWSVDTLDWSGLSAEEIVDVVEREITPGGIVLQHNFQYGNEGLLEGTVAAIPKIVDELRARGYTFVTVQTLLESQR